MKLRVVIASGQWLIRLLALAATALCITRLVWCGSIQNVRCIVCNAQAT